MIMIVIGHSSLLENETDNFMIEPLLQCSRLYKNRCKNFFCYYSHKKVFTIIYSYQVFVGDKCNALEYLKEC